MTWFRDHLPKGQLVLDTSALINILGCGAGIDVFRVLTLPCIVEETVLAEILRHPVPGLCHQHALEQLEASGFIQRTSMDEREYEEYLGMVQAPLTERLDAGESATLAVAYRRSLSVVMDENKGRAYLGRRYPHMTAVSTLKLLISSTSRLNRDVPFLQRLMEQARRNARMAVPKEEKSLWTEIMAATVSAGLEPV
ncbi:MAG: hypothetical protein JWR21_2600 [Herminiimonas sp.]|nr:hypothetical protein [Herminiimonas sp.]